MLSSNVGWAKRTVWSAIWASLVLLSVNEVTLCSETGEGTVLRAPRVLFKHKSVHIAENFQEQFIYGLSKELRVRQRKLMQSIEASDLQVQSLGSNTGYHMIEVPPGMSVSDVLKALLDHPGVEHAEEDKLLKAYSQPNDPDLPQQWAMYKLGLFTDSPLVDGQSDMGAWNRSIGSPDVVVCVIDSGIDYTHPDLQGNVWINHGEIPNNGIDDDKNGYIDDYHGFSFLSNTGDPMDNNYHGTHLSGMVGALCNNNIGVCGVNQNVKVMGCKFLDASGNGYTSDAVRCLDYALQMGADITLNSYGGLYADSYALQSAIEAADGKGQLFVTAAGNDYGVDIDATPTYPAAYRNANIMSVVATDQNDGLANYSNFGKNNADIAAPGSKILSTILNGQYGMHEGTSQSAGFVAGAAALLLAANRAAGYNVTGAQMKDFLMRGVLRTPSLDQKCKSGGMLDIGRSMSLVPPSLVQPTAEAPAPAPEQLIGQLVEAAPSLSDSPFKANRAKLVLGNYPPTPEEAVKSTSTEPPPYIPTGTPPSIAQYFSGGFPLQHSTLTFLPQFDGSFLTCAMSSINQMPSNVSYGQDITQQLLSGQLVTIDLEDVQIGNLDIWQLVIRLDGTLQLQPRSSSSDGSNQAVSAQSEPASADATAESSALAAFQNAPQIGCLVGAGLSLKDGGQVSWYMRPDRLVVSFMYVASTQSPQKSTFQAEIFTRSGHYQPVGTVRMTWLDVGAQRGVVGISLGTPATPSAIDFQNLVACQKPAKLWVDTAATQPVTLPATQPGQSAAVAPRSMYIANKGNTSLVVALQAVHRSDSVLRPELWLSPASGYTATFGGVGPAEGCSSDSSQEMCYSFGNGSSGIGSRSGEMSIRDDGGAPARYAQQLQVPLRLRAQVVRDRPCSNAFLVISSAATPPSQPGEGGALWVALDCGQSVLHIPGLAALGEGDMCVDFSSIGMTVEVGPSSVMVSTDGCSQLAAGHSLGPGPFYLFLGSNCSSADCPGGVEWERLEVESGPNVHLDALDGLAAAPDTPSKILVMQQPNSTVSFTPSFLQELLSLSPYPAAPTLGAPPGPPPPPIILPPKPQRAGSDGGQVSAASVEQQGRRLLDGTLMGPSTLAAPAGPAGPGVVQALKKAISATAAKALNALSPALAGVGPVLAPAPAFGKPSDQAERLDGSGSSEWVSGAAAAPADGAPSRETGEGPRTVGKQTELRTRLSLPVDGDLAAVAFLDMGSPELAVSPEGGPGGSQGVVGSTTPEVAVNWLSLNSPMLVIPSYGKQAAQLNFTSAGLSAGSYQATLVIQSNDPDQPLLRLPLDLKLV